MCCIVDVLCSAGMMPSYEQENADDIFLYDIYGDSMLFLQNAVAELAGVAPSGSFSEYTLHLSANGKPLTALRHIVFGEQSRNRA